MQIKKETLDYINRGILVKLFSRDFHCDSNFLTSAQLGELSGFSLQHISAGRIPTLSYNDRQCDGVKGEIMNITFCRPGFRLWIWNFFVLLTFVQLLSACEPQFSQKIEIISSILTVAGKIQLSNLSARE